MADIPECPFEILGDLVCAEFLEEKRTITLPSTTKKEELGGKFVVIGVGPGLPDKDGNVTPPSFSRGEEIFFQKQNAYMFQDSARIPDRYFAMIRAGMILAKWKGPTTPVERILATA